MRHTSKGKATMAKRTTTPATTSTPVATLAPARQHYGNGVVVPRTASLRSIGAQAYAALLAQGAPVCPQALALAIATGCAGTAWVAQPAAFYKHRARRTLALYGQAIVG